jgi:hypothetical protein
MLSGRKSVVAESTAERLARLEEQHNRLLRDFETMREMLEELSKMQVQQNHALETLAPKLEAIVLEMQPISVMLRAGAGVRGVWAFVFSLLVAAGAAWSLYSGVIGFFSNTPK